MTESKAINKAYKKTVLLFMLLYMVSYITRINYGAVISEMVAETSISKAMLSMALTGSFITYGAGQIISGICGDRVSPKKLIFSALLVTSAMNLLIPLCKSPQMMLAVWCINGLSQAFMWPPLVKLMVTLFSEEEYSRASVTVSWGSSAGTMLVYLVSPLIITVSGWKSVFFVSALLGIAMSVIWLISCPCINTKEKATQIVSEKKQQRIFTPLLVLIMLAIVMQGMLRDGVTTWMPSYISETYNISNAISILTGVIMPLFSILCFQLTSRLYMYKLKNPMTCSAVIFGCGAACSALLYFITGKNAALSVLLSALLTACMHGVNLVLICFIPSFYRKKGNISTISGILNSCTYIGSAVSTYAIALISEKGGWSLTVFIWFLIAAAGTAICSICIKPFFRSHDIW